MELPDNYATETTTCSSRCSLETFIHLRKARAAGVGGRWSAAVKAAQAAARLSPDFFFAHLWVARYALDTKLFEVAEAAATRAIELDPDSGVYSFRRIARENLEDRVGAAEDWRAMVRRKPDYFSYRLSLGEALLRIGEASAALESFEEARKLDDTSDSAWRGIARAHAALGDTKAAEEASAHADRLAS